MTKFERLDEIGERKPKPVKEPVRRGLAIAKRLLPPLKPRHDADGLVATFIIGELGAPKQTNEARVEHRVFCEIAGLPAKLKPHADDTEEIFAIDTGGVEQRLRDAGIELLGVYQNGLRRVRRLTHSFEALEGFEPHTIRYFVEEVRPE